MTNELTPWFKKSMKPARVGVYETTSTTQRLFQHWNGTFWGFSAKTPDMAAHSAFRDYKSCFQYDEWRGLAKEPK